MTKKRKTPETGRDRLKRVPLWQWGLITVLAGVFANLLLGMVQGPTGSSAAERGQAFGRAAATLLFVIIGIVLIVMDVVRRRR